jgi:hypothetical protein
MRIRSHNLAISLLALLAGAVAASADSSSLSFSPSSSSTSAGQTFTTHIVLNADQAFNGLSIYLQASAANAFEVTAQSPLNASLSNASFTGTFPYIIPSTGNSLDLGYFAFTNVLASGSDPIESLTIEPLPGLAPGQYTLSTTSGANGSALSYLTGNSGNPVADFTLTPGQSAVYTLTIPVPEPRALPLTLIAAAILLLARPKRAVE